MEDAARKRGLPKRIPHGALPGVGGGVESSYGTVNASTTQVPFSSTSTTVHVIPAPGPVSR